MAIVQDEPDVDDTDDLLIHVEATEQFPIWRSIMKPTVLLTAAIIVAASSPPPMPPPGTLAALFRQPLEIERASENDSTEYDQ